MRHLLGMLVLLAGAAGAAEPDDTDRAVQSVASEYLRAATGDSESNGKQLLLGGVSMTADLLQLENAKIVGREPGRHEQATMASAFAHMDAMDKAGRQALAKLIGSSHDSDELHVTELTKEQATQLLAPTQERARRFMHDHPVLAYAIRVDREVYWHPKNPMRALLQKVGRKGQYTLDLFIFKVRSVEGTSHTPREWPLRVLRFRSGAVDTGWKVLPASDWSID